MVLIYPSFTCRYSCKIKAPPAITFLVAFASLSSIIFKISSSSSEANLLLSAIVYLSSAVSIVYLAQWKSLRTCMTSFNLNQWDEWFRKVWEIWLLKLPQGRTVLKLLTRNTGGIVMQLNLGWNSKTSHVQGKKVTEV